MPTGNLLDRADRFIAAERVYRIALSPEKQRRIRRIRDEIGEGPQLSEALEFLNESSALDVMALADLLRAPFIRTPFRNDQRFSNGTFGVLYTARERETAGAEYGYWAPKVFRPAPGTSYRVRVHVISCWLEGSAKDVRQFLSECPWLTANAYIECQNLGTAAKAEGLAALIAPSARRPNGATVPIFKGDAASQPLEEGEVVYSVGSAVATFVMT